jgi:catechol 2,3-dioxygenase-like lactoylglutathione lyase family enzyme
MGLDLYMLGLVVRDMQQALEFYRRLGLTIPEGSEAKSHVQIKMNNGLTLFLDSNPARWDPAFADQPEFERNAANARYPMVLEFYFEEQRAVAAKYEELVNFGYHGYRAPYVTPFNMYFAMVQDPDGNTILLSAELASGEVAKQ